MRQVLGVACMMVGCTYEFHELLWVSGLIFGGQDHMGAGGKGQHHFENKNVEGGSGDGEGMSRGEMPGSLAMEVRKITTLR